MLLGILLFELPCFLKRDVRMLDSAQICTSIGLNNNQIAGFDLEACVFLDVEHIRTVALECYDVQKLVLVGVRQAWLAAIGT
jgi:uncharacterized ferredoxin-like protein